MNKLRNKRSDNPEKMLARLLPVYAGGLPVGARLGDWSDGKAAAGSASATEPSPTSPAPKPGRQWQCYSGRFVLLKRKWSVSLRDWQAICNTA